VRKGGVLLLGGGLGLLGAGLVYISRRFLKAEDRPVVVPPSTPLSPLPQPLQTGYFHLERMDVKAGQKVKRGQVLGIMGADPNSGPRHLHWELAPYPFPGGEYSRQSTFNPRPWLESGKFAWPVEMWNGRKPVISSKHRFENPDRETHAGVDIMFARLDSDTQPVRKGEGAPRFVAPRGIRVLAAAEGVVTRADWIDTGYRIWVAHA
jgi:murein DD-endopeptidase MepM/ murein hydrolase activator NlpD